MKKILFNLGLVSGCLVFSAIHSQIQAQTRTVTGTVNNGEKSLSGVVVTQEGTNHLTTTTETGVFSLQITGENPILIFRHPEYGERKIPTDGKSTFTITLTEKVKSIEEVVLNAGYYNVKSKESTGSIAKVTAKDIENQPVNNVLSVVQGRMAGVNITSSGGVPGGGYNVEIRGRNSLRTLSTSGTDGSQPLYVIDGVPISGGMNSEFSGGILPARNINPLNSINPNDIESIEILKDADATAIYGSRGANGIVLITTKKGKSGKTDVRLDISYGISNAISNLRLLNTEQYLEMRRQAFLNDGITVYPNEAYDINGTWDQNRNTNWQRKLIGGTATSSKIQSSIAGGTETTRFLLSLGHSEQTTVFPGDFNYKSNTISSNFNHQSRDKRLRVGMSNLFSLQDNNLINTDLTQQSIWMVPNAPMLYLQDGSLNWENNTFDNPLAKLAATYRNRNLQFLNNITFSYEFVPNLTVRVNGGVNYQTLKEITLRPHTQYAPFWGTTSANSSAFKNTQDRFSYIIEPQLNWKLRKNNHELDILAGGTYQQETNQQFSIQGYGFISDAFIENLSAAQLKILSDDVQIIYKYAALYGRVNYQFKDRYILNVTGRRDGSSRFGTNNKFANFGAVGAAWIFSKEEIFKDLKWLSFGKIRGSYGSAGSDNIGDYQYADTYTVSALTYDGIPGLLPSRLYNPDYSWEKTTKMEAALEAGFFNNRLNISTAFYRNRSSNQLVGYQLPSITGFPSILANLPATVENTGIEIELHGRPVKNGSLQWNSGFNISFPKSKLISFPNLEGSTYSNKYVIGMPITIVKVFLYEGINPETGMYKFTDFDGDGDISSPNDNKIAEDIGVKYFGGWNNQFEYKNWDFSFLVQFVKQRNFNYNRIMSTIPGDMYNQPVEVLNVWSVENPHGTYMPYSTGMDFDKYMSHYNFINSTAAISDASFLRLKNIQLGYRIPLKGNLLREAKVFFQGQNLYTYTKYFGMDPEFIGIGYLPSLKTYSFGLQLNF